MIQNVLTNEGAFDRPQRILFVFARLAGGGEETELRVLAQALDPARHRIDVVVCFHKDGMTQRTHAQLTAAGVAVDTTPYHLSFDATVEYLASIVPGYDVVVSCQNVGDIHRALERLHLRPPLVELGRSVSAALDGPKHLTARHVGACRRIRDAAASMMPGREHDAIELPPMVDTAAFDPADRAAMRAALRIPRDTPLIGWIGRLDPAKRAEDCIAAAARVHAVRPRARFVIVGGPDALQPDHAVTLRAQAEALGLGGVLTFLGDRADVAALLAAIDILVWLSRGDGMPHVIAEAGAAALPVIATTEVGGLVVPHEDPQAVAAAIVRLIDDPAEAAALGRALQAKVRTGHSIEAVVPRWTALFDTLRRPPASVPALFNSFFHGGFECSTHRRAHDRRRVDVIAATRHDRLAAADYATLQGHGILTVRDGLRWHLIEQAPGVYDWSSLEHQLAAAAATGTQVIWDLLHYGWPDDVDVWQPDFAARFAAFAAAAARVIGQRLPGAHFYAPVNEISFLSWGGGDAGYLNPFATGRGLELKVQLARAAIAAMEAILTVDPAARFVHADPVINIVTDPARPADSPVAQGHHKAQFQGWDMIAGRAWPQIGGRPELLDIVGVNFYHNNQWVHGGAPLGRGDALYRPFHLLLAETYARYGRPIFVAETGIEGDARPEWLAGICDEVALAIDLGVPVAGICLYPVLDHTGWDDERYCPNGLLHCDPQSDARQPFIPLAAELARQRMRFPG